MGLDRVLHVVFDTHLLCASNSARLAWLRCGVRDALCGLPVSRYPRSGSAVVLALTGWLLYRPGRACPTDPDLAEQCGRAHLWNLRFFWVAAAVWMVGVAAAYLALPIYLWLGGE